MPGLARSATRATLATGSTIAVLTVPLPEQPRVATMATDTHTQPPQETAPQASTGGRQPQPRGLGYAVKRAALGPALPTANLAHERLGKIGALAIFSSDALSSVAYATEEMLKTLFIAGVGAVAFTLIMPLSAAIVGVLAILVFSYRQTIKAYPSAGGAYIVTKDNFGLIPAQVAGVALLTDYVLTVAVSVSAGVAALIALWPATAPYRVEMAVLVHRADRVRQPPRGARVREDLLRADLRVHRLHPVAARRSGSAR